MWKPGEGWKVTILAWTILTSNVDVKDIIPNYFFTECHASRSSRAISIPREMARWLDQHADIPLCILLSFGAVFFRAFVGGLSVDFHREAVVIDLFL